MDDQPWTELKNLIYFLRSTARIFEDSLEFTLLYEPIHNDLKLSTESAEGSFLKFKGK